MNTDGGDIKWRAAVGNVTAIAQEVKQRFSILSEISLLGTHTKQIKADTQARVCTSKFIVVLCIIAKEWQ